jgi:uncharacterized membrane protein (DUF4010 family)
LGPNRGVLLNGLAGGLVSTTATTLALATRTRRSPGFAGFMGLSAGLANAVQLPKLLVLIWVVNSDLGARMAPVLILGSAAGLVALGSIVMLGTRSREDDLSTVVVYRNPFSLTPALKFGALFVVVLFVVRITENWFGDGGTLVASVLGGAVSATATSLSIANRAEQGVMETATAVLPILLALTSNALVKQALALAQGTTAYAWRLGVGFLLILGTSWLAFALLG